MKTHAIAAAMALALLLPLTACSTSDNTSTNGASTEPPATQGTSSIAMEVQKGIDQAKRELQTKDISVDSVHVGGSETHGDSNRPKAVITTQGTLVIAGKPVDATPEQHAMLLDYRQQIIGIAEAGMDIGASGADLGMSAAKQAIWGALSGKSDKEIEARIKPQTEQIKAAAMKLCQRMPDLLTSQQKLAAAMPAFRPYATMTQKDIDDCGKETTDKDGKKGFAVFSD